MGNSKSASRAAFVEKLLVPVNLDGDQFIREIEQDENASFHRLWIEAEAAAHAFQAAHWAALGARFYNKAEVRTAEMEEAISKIRAHGAVSALMDCPAMRQEDIASKRRVYKLCGRGGARWMKPWDDAIAADEARLRAKRGR